ncbi:carboxypeptidase-like regulatory domain-containing protein [Polaribacter sp. Hel_I_88]|uniref:carboxypeptidase-like regulatory domain-containing protein n=1 Tax=Polaribacter sp. Hel_I_88 TaxID=1250006 RepID=UPI00047DD488|nr:carboxypeptidase-like regulatory domain-containing protein [Polaribacter sp. Hel_I_88]
MTKNYFLVFLLFLITLSNSFGQKKVISGKIIDAISSKGIANVHIYSTNLGEGTITNTDGNFYLIVTKSDEIQISCIGYDKQTIKISINDIHNLVIKMKPKTELLNEVIINTKTLSVDEILTKTFDNFKKNHFVEPVYYSFYNRIVNFVDKDSTLISLEEYSGKIKQSKSHLTKYNIDKARVKFFGSDAKKQSKEHRLISMTKMYIDNIYKYREDYLKNKGKRIYEYKSVGRSAILDRNCYVISFNTENDNFDQKGEIYIDMKDFAIVRKVTRKRNNKIYKDITFKRENDK